jgi:hypothetical protein
MCPYCKQNAGDGFCQEREGQIPQLFNIPLWITQKNPLRTYSFGEGFKHQIKDELFEMVRMKF